MFPRSTSVFKTAGTFTWTRPSGLKKIRVFVTGAGGGGGSHNSNDAQGGGGAGGTCIKIIDATKLSATTKIVIGKGG